VTPLKEEEIILRATLVAVLLSSLLLCPSAARAARATDNAPPPQGATPVLKNGGITGLDMMTGTVFQEGQSSFSGIALRLRVRNSVFVPALEFLPTIEYWQNTSKIENFDIETRRRDATLGLDLRWEFANKAWKPYAGGGFAMHFLDDELRAPRFGQPRASTGVVKGGVNAMVGADFNLGGRLGSFVELKLLNVSHYRQVKFNTGLGWNF
jgi:hypothetical protein